MNRVFLVLVPRILKRAFLNIKNQFSWLEIANWIVPSGFWGLAVFFSINRVLIGFPSSSPTMKRRVLVPWKKLGGKKKTGKKTNKQDKKKWIDVAVFRFHDRAVLMEPDETKETKSLTGKPINDRIVTFRHHRLVEKKRLCDRKKKKHLENPSSHSKLCNCTRVFGYDSTGGLQDLILFLLLRLAFGFVSTKQPERPSRLLLAGTDAPSAVWRVIWPQIQ